MSSFGFGIKNLPSGASYAGIGFKNEADGWDKEMYQYVYQSQGFAAYPETPFLTWGAIKNMRIQAYSSSDNPVGTEKTHWWSGEGQDRIWNYTYPLGPVSGDLPLQDLPFAAITNFVYQQTAKPGDTLDIQATIKNIGPVKSYLYARFKTYDNVLGWVDRGQDKAFSFLDYEESDIYKPFLPITIPASYPGNQGISISIWVEAFSSRPGADWVKNEWSQVGTMIELLVPESQFGNLSAIFS